MNNGQRVELIIDPEQARTVKFRIYGPESYQGQTITQIELAVTGGILSLTARDGGSTGLIKEATGFYRRHPIELKTLNKALAVLGLCLAPLPAQHADGVEVGE